MLISKNSVEVLAFTKRYNMDVKAFSLSRMYRLLKGDTKFAIISASLDTNTRLQNAKQTTKLKTLIRNQGYGYVQVKGGYTYYDKDLHSTTTSEEISFLINGIDEKTAIAWGRKFGQETILYKDQNGVRYIDCNTKKVVSVFKNDLVTSKQAVQKYFTQLRKGGKKFAFLSEGNFDIDNARLGNLGTYDCIIISNVLD